MDLRVDATLRGSRGLLANVWFGQAAIALGLLVVNQISNVGCYTLVMKIFLWNG